MNEKEYQAYVAKNETARWDVETDCIVIADIARQLTRIADQGGSNRLFEKVVESVAKQYEQQAAPAPDALVEALKGAVKGMGYIIKNPAHLEDNIRCWHDKLANALADHEKAVR